MSWPHFYRASDLHKHTIFLRTNCEKLSLTKANARHKRYRNSKERRL